MKRVYYNNTSFLDLLFNFLLATMILLVIAVLHIVVEHKKADIKTQAEFVLTVTWPKEIDHDVDTWVRDPNRNILWFRQKEIGVCHLDRDDLGHLSNDWTFGPDGTISYNPNQEIITIRGIVPGEWVFNLHLYRKGTNYGLPITVSVSLIKLNPTATTLFYKEIQMEEYWQEKTVARVRLGEHGDVLSVEDGPMIKLVEEKQAQPRYLQ